MGHQPLNLAHLALADRHAENSSHLNQAAESQECYEGIFGSPSGDWSHLLRTQLLPKSKRQQDEQGKDEQQVPWTPLRPPVIAGCQHNADDPEASRQREDDMGATLTVTSFYLEDR